MGKRRFLAVAFLLCACFPVIGDAQNTRAPLIEGAEIGIDAEEISYDQRADTIVARGAVVIKRGDTELRADEVTLNRATNEAEAHGNVSVTNPEGTVVAEVMQLNLDDETGLLEQAEIISPRYQYSLRGDRVEKGVGQTYHIVNGRFTTCNCADGRPSWSISGQDFRVALGGYGTLRSGTFNILDVPIFYLPRALFPIQRDRQSGFLLPRFGASNRRGFQMLLPFYWAIDKSQDATVALDVETSARAGLVGEYRYLLQRDMRGVLNGSYFNESFRGAVSVGVTPPEDRWSLLTEQDHALGGHARAYTDVFIVSDDQFVRDINTFAFDYHREVAFRTLPFTASRAGIVQLWNRLGLRGEGTYYQDLTGPDSQTLQRAPELDTWGQIRLGEHVLGDLTAGAVDFQRGHGVTGFRFDMEPGATVPLPLGRGAFGAIRASVRETAYHLTDRMADSSSTDAFGHTVSTGVLPRDQSRELFQVDAEIGTSLDRVYPVHWMGLEKIKHTLEPEIAYLYVPAVSQGDQPFFDGADRVNHRNLVTYGLVSRFIGKFAASGATETGTATEATRDASGGFVRELGRLSLSQSVDINREIGSVQTGRAADHFSDVDFGGELNPSQLLSVRFHTNYDTGTNNISAARVGFFVEDPRGARSGADAPRLSTRTSAGVSYRFLTQNFLQEVDDNVVLRLTDWAGFLYSSRYDVVANRFLDNYLGLRFISTCDCWALDVAVADRTNPQEVEVRAQVTLVGLGSSKPQSRVAAVP